MRIPRPVGLAIGITVLYLGMIFVGASFLGAGHGSGFFFVALCAPISSASPWGVAIGPTIAILLACRRFLLCRLLAAIVLLVHYYGIYTIIIEMNWRSVERLLRAGAGLVLVYAATQAFMWCLILCSPRKANKDSAANGSQPIQSETDQTSSAAGSRR